MADHTEHGARRTSFQVGRGSDVLEVVHVDDVDDGRHDSGLVLRSKSSSCPQNGNNRKCGSKINMY